MPSATRCPIFLLHPAQPGGRTAPRLRRAERHRGDEREQATLSVSTLYTTLGRLQEQGLIERSDDSEETPAPGCRARSTS